MVRLETIWEIEQNIEIVAKFHWKTKTFLFCWQYAACDLVHNISVEQRAYRGDGVTVV